MLRSDSIDKNFMHRHGSVAALKNIALSVTDGDFVSITGPSGSGKSTLLLVLGGMLRPDTGEVYWDDQPIYAWKPAKRADWRASKVGFVFQSFNLIPYLNVFDNVKIALDLAQNSDRANNDIHAIHALIERMKLADRLYHLPSELSVGQQQRVALARAIIKNPDIILADEPTGNLDPETGNEIISMLLESNRQGKTVILITHDPHLAAMAPRTVRIVDGTIQNI